MRRWISAGVLAGAIAAAGAGVFNAPRAAQPPSYYPSLNIAVGDASVGMAHTVKCGSGMSCSVAAGVATASVASSPEATQLAANGTNCATGQAMLGVDKSGNAEGCWTPNSLAPTTCDDGKFVSAIGTGSATCSTPLIDVVEQTTNWPACAAGAFYTGTGGGGMDCVTPSTTLTAITATVLGGVKGTGSSTGCAAGYVVSGFAADGTMQCSLDQTGGSSYTLTQMQAATLGGVQGTGTSTECPANGVVKGFKPDGGNMECLTLNALAQSPGPNGCGQGQVPIQGDAGWGCATPFSGISGGACVGEQSVVAIASDGTVTCGTRKIAEDLHGTVKGRGSSLGTTCPGGFVMSGFNTSVTEGDPDYGRMTCVNPLASKGCSAPNVLRAFDSSGNATCVAPTIGACAYPEAVTATTAGGVTCNTFPAISTCSAGQYISGFAANGLPYCSAPTLSEIDPQVNAVTAGRWCKGTGTQVDCSTVYPLAGSSCGANQYATSISAAGTLTCATPSVGSITGGTCSAGYVMVGITTAGVPVCRALTGACAGCLTGY